MTQTYKQTNTFHDCQRLLNELGWTWDYPRVLDWLARVGMIYAGRPFTLEGSIPEFVLSGLARFLHLRLECQKLLNLLGWSWNAPELRPIKIRYRLGGMFPLRGYQELYELLDEAWFVNGGGF